ncbi:MULTISPECIES: TetR/AcrR family transcriptional regulator [Rhizobium/Agrobacterium group]|uniref:TetR/AcrR family transcriptional regulator n=1 Tax=Rhizobium/Agrobacterium group TaxID=227290 RepID=UPI000BD597B8|nr:MULTISPECIES: TetR/AcrR family transcriptional regulator [Rhizobium/Agrobacterium group]MDH7808696.1 AcrR family transcriptional regulator [Rhizobium sp. AN67]MDQ4409263.1 TetR/AcrR family transcriptional regulator [Rhizobium sp. AN63]MQB04787.1 TetR/AcrR family transcriptional regulator [Agrobacterium tumefaciens]SOD50811.1 transcriptional regulator, TetR family [Rhizobium sp. AN6A]
MRRTQAERSEETRKKLCQAALDAMNEVGYGRFSTEDVALRANVSRGALTHQFPSRNALIIAAFDYLIVSWETDWLDFIVKNERRLSPDEVTDFLWDRLFQAGNYIASLEIMLASRNDDELGNGIREIMVKWASSRDNAIATLLGVSLDRPETDEFIQLSLCVLRGIALHSSFSSNSTKELQRSLLGKWKEMLVAVYGNDWQMQ